MLQLNGVSKYFGGLKALLDVTLEVKEGQIKGLIGPNGAGKTTLFNLITGVFPPTGGWIRFLGRETTHLESEKIARFGISRTFQQPHLFKSLTVWENVMLGRHYRTRAEFLACGLRFPRASREEREIRERSLDYLNLFGMADKKDQIASKLPLGEQRYLEVTRALATEPRLLLLDEPTSGLNDYETGQFRDFLFNIRERGITLLVIEHHMRFIMGLCEEIAVLNFGIKIAEGSPREIQGSPEVITAYLGAEENID